MKKKLKVFTNGVIINNPVFRLALGMCPTLAVTTGAINGLSMGLAATFVLICSNVLISALRKVIPDKVRIPAFILIIATFVTLVQMVMRKFLPSLYDSLGIFLPLIVVNCLILARAEAFASTNTVLDSGIDGLGMGLGFTVSLTIIGLIREFLGGGTVFSLAIKPLQSFSMTIFILPAGGFLVLGLLMALYNHIFAKIEEKRKNRNKENSINEEMKEVEQ